jgi:lipoprotein-anchoring transpeptidase ErfK/SrfK
MRVHGSQGTRTGWLGAIAGHRQRLVITGLAGIVALLAAACSGGQSPQQKAASFAPRLVITPANGTGKVKPGQIVTVGVTHGKVEQVTLITKDSDPVSGDFNQAHTAWRSSWTLQPARAYTVTATIATAAGKSVTKTSTFRTMKPTATFQAKITEQTGQTYGVGMPIMLTFNHPVKNKTAVERAMEIQSSKPVTGAWYWDGDEALNFRPRTYWPQHTRVSFTAHLAGVEASPGVFATGNLTQSFRIGDSLIAVVSASHHYAKIYYRNRLFGHWPVSTGSPGDDTANGTYLTIEKGNPVLMSGPGYTDFPVPYSVRFTWSGNFMHDAYWSVGQQGYLNVSHGCVNMSPAHAAVYYRLAVPGDPVTITGSPAAGIWDDGWTEWFLSWKQMLNKSATHEAVKAGESGSTFVNPSTVTPQTVGSPTEGPRNGNFHAS